MGEDCKDRNHVGLDDVVMGKRVLDDLGQDAAALAFMLRNREDRIRELEGAIRMHKAAQGHEMCWENDETLYSVLPEQNKVDHTPPARCEFRQKCRAYYESRPGAEKKDDGW